MCIKRKPRGVIVLDTNAEKGRQKYKVFISTVSRGPNTVGSNQADKTHKVQAKSKSKNTEWSVFINERGDGEANKENVGTENARKDKEDEILWSQAGLLQSIPTDTNSLVCSCILFFPSFTCLWIEQFYSYFTYLLCQKILFPPLSLSSSLCNLTSMCIHHFCVLWWSSIKTCTGST